MGSEQSFVRRTKERTNGETRRREPTLRVKRRRRTNNFFAKPLYSSGQNSVWGPVFLVALWSRDDSILDCVSFQKARVFDHVNQMWPKKVRRVKSMRIRLGFEVIVERNLLFGAINLRLAYATYWLLDGYSWTPKWVVMKKKIFIFLLLNKINSYFSKKSKGGLDVEQFLNGPLHISYIDRFVFRSLSNKPKKFDFLSIYHPPLYWSNIHLTDSWLQETRLSKRQLITLPNDPRWPRTYRGEYHLQKLFLC